MAREGTNDPTGNTGAMGPVVSAAGIDNFSIGFWFWCDDVGGLNTSIKVYNGDGSANGYGLTINHTAGWIQTIHGGLGWFGGGSFGATSVWHSGILVRNAGTSQIYLDGSAIGSSYPDAPNALGAGSPVFGIKDVYTADGTVHVRGAEAFIYSRVLTSAEITAIGANRYSPLFFRQNLLEYYPIIGANNPEPSRTSSNVATVTTFPKAVDHPDILYPGEPWSGARLRPRPFAPGLAR